MDKFKIKWVYNGENDEDNLKIDFCIFDYQASALTFIELIFLSLHLNLQQLLSIY